MENTLLLLHSSFLSFILIFFFSLFLLLLLLLRLASHVFLSLPLNILFTAWFHLRYKTSNESQSIFFLSLSHPLLSHLSIFFFFYHNLLLLFLFYYQILILIISVTLTPTSIKPECQKAIRVTATFRMNPNSLGIFFIIWFCFSINLQD